MITIRDCLAKLHAGEVCNLVVVTYDKRRRDKCGRVLHYPECQLVWGESSEQKPLHVADRQPTPLEKRLSGLSTADFGKKPNHGEHYTRNIRVLQQGMSTEMVVKIHPALIIQFNGQTTCP